MKKLRNVESGFSGNEHGQYSTNNRAYRNYSDCNSAVGYWRCINLGTP